MENRSFYNEILTEHNVHPEFKHDLPDADIVLEGVNPSCGDDIWLKLKDRRRHDCRRRVHRRRLRHLAGVGGYHARHGHRPEEGRGAAARPDLFMRMIQGEASEEEIESLEEASALRDIAHMPARVKCAVLGWRTLKEAIGPKK